MTKQQTTQGKLMTICADDRDDLHRMLKAFYEEAGCSYMSDARAVAELSGLSVQRVRGLVLKYSALRWKILHGRRLEWLASVTTSHAKASPGIVGHAVGTSGYQRAAIVAVTA